MFSSRLVSPGGELERVFHRWLASNIWCVREVWQRRARTLRESERERGPPPPPPPLLWCTTTTIGTTFPAATGVTTTITIATTGRHLMPPRPPPSLPPSTTSTTTTTATIRVARDSVTRLMKTN